MHTWPMCNLAQTSDAFYDASEAERERDQGTMLEKRDVEECETAVKYHFCVWTGGCVCGFARVSPSLLFFIYFCIVPIGNNFDPS